MLSPFRYIHGSEDKLLNLKYLLTDFIAQYYLEQIKAYIHSLEVNLCLRFSIQYTYCKHKCTQFIELYYQW